MTRRTVKELVLTDTEGQELLTKTRAAAVALAEFWDTLRQLESAHECSIEYGELIDELAGECDLPPSFDDLRDVTTDDLLDRLEVRDA